MTDEINLIKPKKPTTIAEALQKEGNRSRIEQALSGNINLDEFISNLLIEINTNELLSQCTFASIMQCAIDAANFGLIPNSQLGHVWLIPYKNYNKNTRQTVSEARLQIGYKGYIKKLYENNITIEVEVVTKDEVEQERFEELRGSEQRLLHKPIREGVRSKGSIALAYAIARKDGMRDVMDVMSIGEIEEAAKTEFYNTTTKRKERALKGVWTSNRITDYIEMCKKTLIIRVAKKCPIDIAQKMAAYEYNIMDDLQDVSAKPRQDKNVIDILSSFNNYRYLPKEEESLNPAKEKTADIIKLINQTKTNDELINIITSNQNHIDAMPDNLSSEITINFALQQQHLAKGE